MSGEQGERRRRTGEPRSRSQGRRDPASGRRGASGGERQQRGPQRTVQPARRVAYDVLRAVSESEAYANLILPPAIAEAGLNPQDAALATELAYGTLRRRGTYDAIISAAADRPADEIDPAVLDALRLATHQLLATRVASHAAVNESVNLVAMAQGRGASSFANAVLRRITRETPEEWEKRIEDSARSDDERLALRSAHPVWVIRALRRALAAEGRADELDDLLDADNASPEVTLVALPGLAEQGEPRRPYAPTAYGSPGGDPHRVIAASGGTVRVQDEGSQLVALALAEAAPIAEGERWLDLCAGPGGKTALLAAVAGPHHVTLEANEVVPTRARLVRNALRAVPGEIVVHEEDGRTFGASHNGMFNRILVDAPCTGLGALRRRPEARWRKSPADVAELVPLQVELLSSALDALTPGGIVAYATCSPHLAETTGVVQEVLRGRPDITELDARAVVARVAESPIDLADDGSGRVQLWPHRHGTDAMFLALLQRDTTDTLAASDKRSARADEGE
ncbi:RsmB/NOP family class I SAM-dependent RNA methyltransferase [Microbacterium phyllosphaerae]|uniref:RsmB/NOP family class I SAM-dependent RNA methyltransferase n=1 Tax=Microbacterium phyllosphaerae TaxID=124798 RepID=UPI00216A3AA1|nr:transcription antitermination factor NusB [Microbacterium phyllosphaerae]MCS3441288.1 16S rRNA (cytosine967-C5)-methyltransferase [Microbacterium phyllosphaerae]